MQLCSAQDMKCSAVHSQDMKEHVHLEASSICSHRCRLGTFPALPVLHTGILYQRCTGLGKGSRKRHEKLCGKSTIVRLSWWGAMQTFLAPNSTSSMYTLQLHVPETLNCLHHYLASLAPHLHIGACMAQRSLTTGIDTPTCIAYDLLASQDSD